MPDTDTAKPNLTPTVYEIVKDGRIASVFRPADRGVEIYDDEVREIWDKMTERECGLWAGGRRPADARS